jgi:hypothetical protein
MASGVTEATRLMASGVLLFLALPPVYAWSATVQTSSRRSTSCSPVAHPLLLTPEDDIMPTAKAALAELSGLLGDVSSPVSMANLREAMDSENARPQIPELLFLMLIDQTLEYDLLVSEDGDSKRLVPTDVDYSSLDLRVVEKMNFLYLYGIMMFKRRFISAEALKSIVLRCLASRVGMDGAAFDRWLGAPAVEQGQGTEGATEYYPEDVLG